MVEAEASRGNEDAQKLMKRIKKDKSVIVRVLNLLSTIIQGQ